MRGASYDVVVAGGSISGLLCAREIAAGGHSVLVVEEDYEIGTPEHCGGLVSSSGLEEMGMMPFGGTLVHRVKKARITSPDGAHVSIDAKRQNVLCVNRRELDKQAAHQAQRAGADIMIRTSMQERTREGVRISGAGGGGADAGANTVNCRIMVDARGAAALAQRDRDGIIPSAQYEVYADWIEDGMVEVLPDRLKYPGFFAWVIPSGRGRGRVGAAGRGINAAAALESFLTDRGGDDGRGCYIVRKIFAPIWIKGPIKRFHDAGSGTITVGDAAGQAKPTTAGGIFSSGMGGILAGRAISKHLDGGVDGSTHGMDGLGDSSRAAWHERFGGEFERQSIARRILERADNGAINDVIRRVSPEALKEISAEDDFDFHVSGIVKLLGAAGTARAAGSMLGAELRRLIPGQ